MRTSIEYIFLLERSRAVYVIIRLLCVEGFEGYIYMYMNR
jgi:hypothetical protein